MTTPKKILVTGVGAVIGYGIIRSLRASRFPVVIVGTDIYPDAVGKQWCDHFEQAPLVSTPQYPAFLRETIQRHAIDLVMPGIEQDVTFLNLARAQKTFAGLAARFVLNDPQLISVSDDKWLTHLQLQEHGFSTIPTHIGGQFEDLKKDLGLPMLLKPRRSYASKGIDLIHTQEDFDYWNRRLADNFMVQKIVGTVEEEYTVGTFGLGEGKCIEPIIFQRKLNREGATIKARVCELPELTQQVRQLVELFKPVGPTNFQFRRQEGKFLLLEVNPRISSSTSLRTAFGYNEAEMCIEYYLEQAPPSHPRIRFGCAARYIEDLVIYDRADF